MAQLIPASRLADVARNLTMINPPIPYKRAGKSPSDGMDSATFLWYCLKQLGVSIASAGTNTQYKSVNAYAMSLREAKRLGKVVPGAILFHVTPEATNGDHMAGNTIDADYALICLDADHAAYPSQSSGKIIVTNTNLASGRANMIVFHPALDYGFGTAPQPPQVPQREVLKYMRVIAKGTLNLRDNPSLSGSLKARIPEGTRVPVFGYRNGFAETEVPVQGQMVSGWLMMENFLEDA